MTKFQVATALPVAGSTLTFWIPWQTSFASTSSYSSIVQSARLLVQLYAANSWLVLINAHVTWWPRCWIEWVMAAKTKTIHYYIAHNVATRVSFGT